MTPALRNFLLACLFVFALILVKGMQKKQALKKSEQELIQTRSMEANEQTLDLQEFKEESPLAAIDARASWSNFHEPLQTEYELIDRVEQLFNPYGAHLPIVTPMSYNSMVEWLKDRPAWIVDYAAHYGTSKHFISRSLSGKRDYYYDRISEGDRFNVLNPSINFEFALVVSLHEGKMRFYYYDQARSGYVLLKHYRVFLGGREPMTPSGSKTPLGKYLLGNRIAAYKPGHFDLFKKERTEMVRVFGSRWIPFERELSACTAGAKGFGIHGLPWTKNEEGRWIEDPDQMGKYQSDGCIRMHQDDMEELFSIIITRRATVEIVKSFEHAGELYKEVEPKLVEQF